MGRRPRTLRPVRANVIAVCLFASSVTGCGPVELVDPYEAEVLTKVRAGSHELISTSEIAELRARGGAGRYEIFTRGIRTWRFDSATGAYCLMLTSDADWKSRDAQQSSCVR